MKRWLIIILTGLNVCPVLAGPQLQPPGHWQEGGMVGVVELSGEIRVSGPVWLWSTQSLTLMKPGGPLPLRHDGMETGTGPALQPVLAGRTVSLLPSLGPGQRPDVQLKTERLPDGLSRIAVRGVLPGGQVRYGEMTFRATTVMALQDGERASAGKGWQAVSGTGEVVTERLPDGMTEALNRTLMQIPGYNGPAHQSGDTPGSSWFQSRSMQVKNGGNAGIAGAAVLAVSDIRVRFPGAGESVTRWQGNLTPVVNYF
ncbi:hypothetical protein FHN97_20580 [Salmonella enterica]|uniref:hypothetical protein n=1 Tax=Salmonella enterica TaxID=28901 RepID=UPI0009ABEB37|nr:hypothetical protein [Salmonella enterica]ECF7044173.1 hypothetical protein [Salmonella enterica subsp. enterica]EBD0851652.1 hypothetical protein [Salmonella enterica]EBF2435105.1 hypothetical protein [Salmonella enterica]EBN7034248.1 hypothetical protein [Salmonella enterica]ECE2168168.1 hypothetical protein [Salmonella enterica]